MEQTREGYLIFISRRCESWYVAVIHISGGGEDAGKAHNEPCSAVVGFRVAGAQGVGPASHIRDELRFPHIPLPRTVASTRSTFLIASVVSGK